MSDEPHKHGLEQSVRFRVTMPAPFDFRLTVAKPAGWHWSTPGEIFEDPTLWSGTYLGGRAIGLRLSPSKAGASVAAYSEQPLSPDEIRMLRADVASGLGADEDLSAFYKFARRDTVLSETVRDLYGMRAGRLDDVFGRVILAILLQMAPVARSRRMMADLLDGYGTRLTFDGKTVTLWPRPEVIAGLDPGDLGVRAKLGYRAKRLVAAARFLTEQPLPLTALRAQPEEMALKRLMEIPGIGEYSAIIILGRSAAPLDVWSVVIMSELLLGRTPQRPRQELDAVASVLRERWGKWGWMAFVYIVNDLERLAARFRLSRLH